MYLVTLLIALFSVFLLNCNSVEKDTSHKSVEKDTSYKNTLRYKLRNDSLNGKKVVDFLAAEQDSFFKALSDSLGLENIADGFNGYQLRIWAGFAPDDSGKYVIIKNENNDWSAKAYHYSIIRHEENPDSIYYTKNAFDLEPSSGWASFLRKLNALKLNELREYYDLPNYDNCGGDFVAIEIASADSYEVLVLVYPCYVSGPEIKETKTFFKLVDLIQKETRFHFGIKEF